MTISPRPPGGGDAAELKGHWAPSRAGFGTAMGAMVFARLEFAQNTGACDSEVARRYKDSVPAE